MEGGIANTAATSVTGSVTAPVVAIRFSSRINYAADRNSEIKGRLSRTGLLSRSRSELVNVFGRSRRSAAIEQPKEGSHVVEKNRNWLREAAGRSNENEFAV